MGEKKEPEPLFEHLSNPARVMKAQLKVINLDDDKYRPIKDISIGGIVMLDRARWGRRKRNRLWSPWRSIREQPLGLRRKERNLHLLSLSSGQKIKWKIISYTSVLNGVYYVLICLFFKLANNIGEISAK